MNTGLNGNPNNPTGPANPGPRWDPGRWAAAVGMHVKSLVVSLFWGVVGLAALAAGYVAFRGILWAAQQILHALGV